MQSFCYCLTIPNDTKIISVISTVERLSCTGSIKSVWSGNDLSDASDKKKLKTTIGNHKNIALEIYCQTITNPINWLFQLILIDSEILNRCQFRVTVQWNNFKWTVKNKARHTCTFPRVHLTFFCEVTVAVVVNMRHSKVL